MRAQRWLIPATVAAFAALAPDARGASTMPDQGPGPDLLALRHAAMLYPQPVRVGDLADRYLLAPTEAQPVLARVAAAPILRRPDGTLEMAVERGGILGLGRTRVLLPLADVALMGEHVALIGQTAAMLGAIAPASGEGVALPADAVIPMGIVGPFH